MNRLLEMGRQGILDDSINFNTDTIAVALMDLNTASTAVKQILSSTNASPIVITTSAAHGFTTGDLVFIDGHTTNTSANGLWAITAASGSVFSLTDYISGTNSTGNGVGGATGYAVDYGATGTTVDDNYDDWVAGLVGAKLSLGSKTFSAGVFDAADATFPTVSGASVEAILIFKDTGTNSTSRTIGLITGKQLVTADATLTAGTTLVVEPVTAGIPNGTVLPFSTGQSATVNATVNAGDRAITVLSTTITSAARALAPITASGLPVTPNGGNIVVTWDNGVNRIFKL